MHFSNYQDKHTPPQFLDYILGATEKSAFYTSQYKSETKSSEVEYPNATLKQNRNYEVGIVLADKFGRQSTPIFSKQSIYSSLGPFLASAIYSPYRGRKPIKIIQLSYQVNQWRYYQLIDKLLTKFEVKNSVELIAKYVKYKSANRENIGGSIPPFKNI